MSSCMSLFVTVLSFLRIVPPGKYDWKDIVLHVIWIVVGFVSSVGNTYNSVQSLDLKNIGPLELSYIGTDCVAILLTTFPFPTLAFFVMKNDYLLIEKLLPWPAQPGLLLVTMTLQIISVGTVVWRYLPVMTSLGACIFLIITQINLLILENATVLLIGTAAAHFCKKTSYIKK